MARGFTAVGVTIDSAGWHVVVPESALVALRARTSQLAGPTVAFRPTADIGFTSAHHAAFRANGGAVVVEPATARISVFDASGREERSVGQKGGGPGEFQGLEGIAMVTAADSIVASDWSARRLTIFGPTDATAHTVTYQHLGLENALIPVGMLDDGAVLGWTMLPGIASPRDTIVRLPAQVVRISIRDSTTRRLTRFPGIERPSRSGDNASPMRSVAFRRDTFVAVAGTGYGLLDTGGATMFVFDSVGRPVGSIEFRIPLAPVTAAMREAELERRLASARGSSDDATRLARLREELRLNVLFPDTKAAIAMPAIWDGARWWFGFGESFRSELEWIGVDSTGAIVAGPRTQAGSLVCAIRDGRALVLTANPDGFIIVGVYRWHVSG